MFFSHSIPACSYNPFYDSQKHFVGNILRLPSDGISKKEKMEAKEASSWFWVETIAYKTTQAVRKFLFGPEMSRNQRNAQYLLDLDVKKYSMENENIYYAFVSLFPFLKKIFDYFECDSSPFQGSFFDRCVEKFFRNEQKIIEALGDFKYFSTKIDEKLLESMWSYRKKISSLQNKDFEKLDLAILESVPSFSAVDKESLLSKMNPESMAGYLVGMTSLDLQDQKLPQELILPKIRSQLGKSSFWIKIAPSFSLVIQLKLFRELRPSEIIDGLQKAFMRKNEMIAFLKGIDNLYSLQNEVYKISIRDKIKSYLDKKQLEDEDLQFIYVDIFKEASSQAPSEESFQRLMIDVFCMTEEDFPDL